MVRAQAFFMLMLVTALTVMLWAHGLTAPAEPAFAALDPWAQGLASGELDARFERAAAALTASLGPPPGAPGYDAVSAQGWADLAAATIGEGPVAYMLPPPEVDPAPEA